MSEAELTAQIASQGAKVKELKLSGKPNDDPEVAAAVIELKALKSALTELTGVEQTGGRAKKAPKPKKEKKESTNKDMKKETKLGMHVGINEDFGAWYSQVVVEAALAADLIRASRSFTNPQKGMPSYLRPFQTFSNPLQDDEKWNNPRNTHQKK